MKNQKPQNKKATSIVNVCFVIPPSPFLYDERVFMSLGILRVAAIVRRAGFSVSLLDLSGITNYLDVLRTRAETGGFDVWALTSTTPQFPCAVKIARHLRKYAPNARIVIGGPHVTLTHAATRQEEKLNHSNRAQRALKQILDEFDVLVAGDGELAMIAALKAPFITGLINADALDSELFLSKEVLSRLPFPARDLIDIESYNFVLEGRPGLSLIAQLGCPFACGFCAGRTSPSFRHIRLRETQDVIEEIKAMYSDFGTTAYMFYDDELNVNPKLLELCESLLRLQETLGQAFRFRGCVKAELFTMKQATALFSAGFRNLLVGFESGDPKVLSSINKKATAEDNYRCVQNAHFSGLKVKALMSVGHPGENWRSIEETVRWLCRARPDELDVSLITVLPGTHYYDFARPTCSKQDEWVYEAPNTKERLYSYEVDFSEVMNYYKGDPRGTYESYVRTDYLSREEMVTARAFVDKEARAELKLPWISTPVTRSYDHSMGQLDPLSPIKS